MPLVEASQSSPVDHPHVVVPALMGGTSQLVDHTLLGPEETAEPVLDYRGRPLSSSAPDRPAIVYRARHGLSGAYQRSGW